MRAAWSAFVALVIAATVLAETEKACLREESGRYHLTHHCVPGESPAWAKFADDVQTTGWARLDIYTAENYGDFDQMIAAGYLEGALTHDYIWDAKNNLFAHDFGNSTNNNTGPGPALIEFMQKQLTFVQDMIAANSNTSDYWYHVALVMAQFDGLVTGYNHAAPPSEQISELEMYMINSAGDLEDLDGLFGAGARASRTRVNPRPIWDAENGMLDCSGFIRLTPEGIFTGHTTWRDYGNMAPRIYKFYNFAIAGWNTSATAVSFSSSPGFLSSKDDFYVTSTGLVTLETTNAIFNGSLYTDYITPNSVLCWQRTMVANYMAYNGEQWTSIFARYNSGTYNNQWMVVDYKVPRTDEGAAGPNTLWILEQIPGTCESADVTEVLNAQGYWPSYNVPYFPKIYNMSGYNTQQAQMWSYNDCPRANIFRMRHANVTSVPTMMWMMQYNEWQTDPLSLGLPSNAISSRFDLMPKSAGTAAPFGGIDSKITNNELVQSLSAYVISGPTHQGQTPYSWSQFPYIVHQGAPETFDFEWQFMDGGHNQTIIV